MKYHKGLHLALKSVGTTTNYIPENYKKFVKLKTWCMCIVLNFYLYRIKTDMVNSSVLNLGSFTTNKWYLNYRIDFHQATRFGLTLAELSA